MPPFPPLGIDHDSYETFNEKRQSETMIVAMGWLRMADGELTNMQQVFEPINIER